MLRVLLENLGDGVVKVAQPQRDLVHVTRVSLEELDHIIGHLGL